MPFKEFEARVLLPDWEPNGKVKKAVFIRLLKQVQGGWMCERLPAVDIDTHHGDYVVHDAYVPIGYRPSKETEFWTDAEVEETCSYLVGTPLDIAIAVGPCSLGGLHADRNGCCRRTIGCCSA